MLYAGVLLDLAVAAVVVGKEQAVARDDLARTAAAEQDDGVLEGSLVDTVHVFGGQPEAVGLHVLDPLGDQHRQPHAFVRPQDREEGQQGQRAHNNSFHIDNKMI